MHLTILSVQNSLAYCIIYNMVLKYQVNINIIWTTGSYNNIINNTFKERVGKQLAKRLFLESFAGYKVNYLYLFEDKVITHVITDLPVRTWLEAIRVPPQICSQFILQVAVIHGKSPFELTWPPCIRDDCCEGLKELLDHPQAKCVGIN